MKSALTNELEAKSHDNLQRLWGQLEETRKFKYERKPLLAEKNEDRRIAYVQARTGIVDKEKARKVANYDETVIPSLTPQEARAASYILQDREPDFQDVFHLQLAMAAIPSVGRVLDRDLSWKATGFMISKRLFITNWHVIEDQEQAENSSVEFNFELDVDKRKKPVTRFDFAPDVFFLSSPWPDGLDFTILAVGETVEGTGSLLDFGFCPLKESEDKHVIGTSANIVGHPEGESKKMSIRNNQIAAQDIDILEYFTATAVGSSGSPVFNYRWEPVALHHWAAPTREIQTPDGKIVSEDANEGIRISAIIRKLRAEMNGLAPDKRLLLEDALNCPYWYPSLLRTHEIRFVA